MITKSLLTLLIIVPAILCVSITSGDNQAWDRTTFSSTFNLGSLYLDQVVTVNFQYPGTALDFAVSLFKATSGSAGSTGVAVGATVQCGSTATCNVLLPAVTSSGEHYIQITYPASSNIIKNSAGGVFTFARVSKLTITGNATQRRANPQIIKQTFIPGQYRYHRIYLSATTDVKVSFYQGSAAQTAISIQDKLIKIVGEVSGSTTYAYTAYAVGANPKDRSSQTVVGTSNVFTFTAVPSGYYWIVVDPSYESLTAAQTAANQILGYNYILSYNTQPYVCTHDKDFPDLKNIFGGCIFPSQVTGLPCVTFNATTQVCSQCYTGYTLVDGKCLQNPCPAGQYKKYGQCLTNPVGCVTYSDFSKCTLCADTYKLNNGTCERVPLVCPDRTYFNKDLYVCSPVSDACKQYSPINGQCTSCKLTSDKVVNGGCVSGAETCGLRQYILNGVCVDIEPLCGTFEKVGGKCTSCIFGYEFNADKKCVAIKCPDRYVPNDYGKCVRVSDLCVNYDIKGFCLQCIPSHLPDASGTCLQIIGTVPCAARQYLGFDNDCHLISQLCEVFNQAAKQCSKCVQGYYLMYSSQCVPQTVCKSRQFLINNDCHDVSPTCGNWDRVSGKCLNCVSQQYELYYGLCIPVTTCGARQWTDDKGDCHQVSNRCNTFNPTTGDCTSCVQGYNYLQGICCENGQFNVNGICVVAQNANSQTNSDGCRIKVSGIGCVRCITGYQIKEDSTGFTFCQKK